MSAILKNLNLARDESLVVSVPRITQRPDLAGQRAIHLHLLPLLGEKAVFQVDCRARRLESRAPLLPALELRLADEREQ